MRYFIALALSAGELTLAASGLNLYDPDCLRGVLGGRYAARFTPRQMQALYDGIADPAKQSEPALSPETRSSALAEISAKIHRITGHAITRAEMDFFGHPTETERVWIVCSPAREEPFLVEAFQMEASDKRVLSSSGKRLLYAVYLSGEEAKWLRERWIEGLPAVSRLSRDLQKNIFKKLRYALGHFLSTESIQNSLRVHPLPGLRFRWSLLLDGERVEGEMFSLPQLSGPQLRRLGAWAKGDAPVPDDAGIDGTFGMRQREIAEILPFIDFVGAPVKLSLSKVLGEVALLKTLRLERSEIARALDLGVNTTANRSQKLYLAVQNIPEFSGYGFTQRDLKFYALGKGRDRLAILVDRKPPALIIATIGSPAESEPLFRLDDLNGSLPVLTVRAPPFPPSLHLSNAERLVLNVLLRAGGTLSSTRSDFAQAAGLTTDGLRSTLRSLRAKGLVERTRFQQGPNGYSVYRLSETFREHWNETESFQGAVPGPVRRVR